MFGVHENIVRIFEVFFPGLPHFAEAIPVVLFNTVQSVDELRVHLGLQREAAVPATPSGAWIRIRI
jgi:hypothetical protein